MPEIAPDTPTPHWNQGRRRHRRPSRQRERAPLTVRSAVPKGRTLPRRVSQWRDEALAHPATSTMTARSWRSYRAFVLAIANAIDPRTMTTKFSWASLGAAVIEFDARAAHSRAGVARYLKLLHELQLLGTVATGRTAQWAPKGEGNTNERAVYVLSVARPLEAVEGFETPPLEEACVAPRTHARGDLAQAEAAPLRGTASQAAQARPDLLPAQRQQPLWPGGVTPKRKDEMLAAAQELQQRTPALRQISDRHIRSILRPFFLAGWTLNDVAHAIDQGPDGSKWPHDGANGVGNLGAWFKNRLAAWLDRHGTVRRSRSQRVRAEQLELAARARARREAEAAARRGKARELSKARLLARAVAEAIETGGPLPAELEDEGGRQAPHPAD